MPFGGENAESYYDEGLTAGMKGELGRAAKCFEKAIRLDNSYAAAYHQLGKVCLRMGDPQRAIDLIAQVVKKKPAQAAPRLDLGYAFLAAGQPQEARKEFEQLLGMDPSNVRATMGLAQTYFADCNWDMAVREAQAAVASGGSNFAALFLLGRAAKFAGNLLLSNSSLESADKLLQKSVELNPDQPEGHYLRGEVYFARDDFPKALEHYRAADDRIGETESDRYFTAFGESFTQLDVLAKQGMCYERLGRADRAREIGERIVARNPDHRLGQSLRNSQ
ncbi:MAG: tetratricopeptide repeat protein [Candidatus Hydrogenedentes bacterium]|nr:tetratricopeptide repeat protein [Candidatus Hydrogenedentota bacterium]